MTELAGVGVAGRAASTAAPPCSAVLCIAADAVTSAAAAPHGDSGRHRPVVGRKIWVSA